MSSDDVTRSVVANECPLRPAGTRCNFCGRMGVGTSSGQDRVEELVERLNSPSAYERYKPFLPFFDRGFWVKSSDIIMPRGRKRRV